MNYVYNWSLTEDTFKVSYKLQAANMIQETSTMQVSTYESLALSM